MVPYPTLSAEKKHENMRDIASSSAVAQRHPRIRRDQDFGRSRRPDWHLHRAISRIKSVRRAYRNRWHLRIGLHAAAGNDSAKSHLRDASSPLDLSQRMGSVRRSGGQCGRQSDTMVALSPKHTSMANTARRAALQAHHSGLAESGNNVSALLARRCRWRERWRRRLLDCPAPWSASSAGCWGGRIG
jgi:hypothetical protein